MTDSDQVIAELAPHKKTRSLFATVAYLANAVRSDVLTPAAVVTTQPPTAIPVAQLDEILNEELDKHRRDR